MRKYPADVSVSETCINANLKMIERWDTDNFHVSRRRNDVPGQYPKLPLNGLNYQENVNLFQMEIISEYDQEIPQSQTADNPLAPRGRAAQPPRDTRKTN